jgi:hypothetical protein
MRDCQRGPIRSVAWCADGFPTGARGALLTALEVDGAAVESTLLVDQCGGGSPARRTPAASPLGKPPPLLSHVGQGRQQAAMADRRPTPRPPCSQAQTWRCAPGHRLVVGDRAPPLDG